MKFGRLMVAFPPVNPCLICLVSDGNKTVQTRESNKILPVNLDWEVSHFILFAAIKLIIFHIPYAAETRVCLRGIWVTHDWNPEIILAVGDATLILTSIAAFSFKYQSRRFFNFQSPRKFNEIHIAMDVYSPKIIQNMLTMGFDPSSYGKGAILPQSKCTGVSCGLGVPRVLCQLLSLGPLSI